MAVRILQLTAENEILLQRIQQLETKINRLKQQGITQNQKDERILNSMVSKSLYLLAEVQSMKVVDGKTISQHAFSLIVKKRFELLLDLFKQRLQYKRMKRLHHYN